MSSVQPAQDQGAAWARFVGTLGLGVILGVFVALGIFYSLQVPLFETPDEPLHYRHVRWLAQERRLPPLVVSQDEWLQGEFHQPPLYYTLGALLTGSIAPTEPDPTMAINPYAMRGFPHARGNKNAMLHKGDEGLPYTGANLAVHLLRWFGILISTATLWFVHRITREILPARRGFALCVTALVAFNPQFVFASAAVNNDTLVVLLSTVTLYLLVLVLQGKQRHLLTPVLVGVMIGLAGLTKLSGLALAALVPLAYLGYVQQQPQRRFWQDLIRPVLVVALVSLALCGWWYLRNLILYGDPFGMRSYRQIFGVFADALSWTQSAKLLLEAFVSYWGVFGWMNVLAAEAYYLVMRIVCLAALGGLALSLIDRIQRRAWTKSEIYPLSLLAIWILIMLSLLYLWTRSITRTQGRLLFPAATGVALFIVLGLDYWITAAGLARFWRRAASLALLLVLLGVAVAAPWAYIRPAYALPTIITLGQTPDTMQGLDLAYGDELVLLGYELPAEPTLVGEELHLRLYWLCRARMQQDYTFYVHLFGRDEVRIAKCDTYPGLGAYPTTAWIPGQVVVDDYWVTVDPAAQAPVAAQVRVGVYTSPDLILLEARDLQGRPVSPAPTIGRAPIVPAASVTYRPAETLEAVLGERVLLFGASFAGEAIVGESLSVTLYWRCLEPMTANYTVFMHLVDQQGNLVTQSDGQPLQGDLPTRYWTPGQEIKDEHQLDLPPDLPPGQYELRAGLYLVETAERLPVMGVPSVDNALSLGSVVVRGRSSP